MAKAKSNALDLSCGDGTTEILKRLSAQSIEGLAGAVGLRQFVLDLRAAPNAVAQWLTELRPFGGGRYDELDVPIGGAFDVLIYTDTVTYASSLLCFSAG